MHFSWKGWENVSLNGLGVKGLTANWFKILTSAMSLEKEEPKARQQKPLEKLCANIEREWESRIIWGMVGRAVRTLLSGWAVLFPLWSVWGQAEFQAEIEWIGTVREGSTSINREGSRSRQIQVIIRHRIDFPRSPTDRLAPETWSMSSAASTIGHIRIVQKKKVKRDNFVLVLD